MSSSTGPTYYGIGVTYTGDPGSQTSGQGQGGGFSFTSDYGWTDDMVLAVYAALSGVTMPPGFGVVCTRSVTTVDDQTASYNSGTPQFNE